MDFDVIKEVGPGGNFLSSRHTLKYFRSEYLEPMLLPRAARTSAETLQDHQPLQILHYARSKAKEIIEGHENLAIPQEIDNRIRERYEIML